MPTLRPWIPALTMWAVSLVSYVDRNTLALLAPTILRDTHLTVEQYGWIISAFSVCYMVANPLWGKLLDRWGLPLGMTLAVGFWTLASASHAVMGSFWGFALARAALGFGEGATFPGALRAVVQSLKPHQQSRGLALSYSGGSLGAIVTPLVVTPIALWWGWRSAFWFTGLIGAGWLVVWSVVSRREDMRRRRVPAGAHVPVRWADRRVWGFMAAYALGGFPLAFVLYQAALYLHRVLGASQADIGRVLWIPPLGWELGYFFWGWLADRHARSGDPVPAHRRLMAAAMLLSLPLGLAPWNGRFILVLVQLFFAMFVAAAFIILPVRYATHTFTTQNAGLVAGLGAGSWAAVVALVMPGFGLLFDRQWYPAAFWLAALAPVAGYTIWGWGARSGATRDLRR